MDVGQGRLSHPERRLLQEWTSAGDAKSNCLSDQRVYQNAQSKFVCVPICKLSQYYDGTGCVECDPTCRSCLEGQPGKCTSCWRGYYLDWPNKKCAPRCLLNEFPDVDGSCKQCPLHCAKCDSATKCTVCTSNAKKIGDLCVLDCEAMGKYSDPVL